MFSEKSGSTSPPRQSSTRLLKTRRCGVIVRRNFDLQTCRLCLSNIPIFIICFCSTTNVSVLETQLRHCFLGLSGRLWRHGPQTANNWNRKYSEQKHICSWKSRLYCAACFKSSLHNLGDIETAIRCFAHIKRTNEDLLQTTWPIWHKT